MTTRAMKTKATTKKDDDKKDDDKKDDDKKDDDKKDDTTKTSPAPEDIKKAPDNLQKTCSTPSNACKLACLPALQCKKRFTSNCAGYAPCEILERGGDDNKGDENKGDD